MNDLILAILHHILVFGLVAMLAIERALVSARTVDVKRLVRLDGGYGATALMIIIVGASRVVWGGKGWAFYQDNPFFWAKIGAFALVGLASVGPTRLFFKWAKAAKADAAFQPPADELKRARTWLGVEALLLVAVLACAAAMARWPF